MKFKIQIQFDDTKKTHWEEYTENVEDPREWAEQTIKNFNNTLRKGESSRTLLDVVVLDSGQDKHHWEKTNFATITGGRLPPHDKYKCSVCGITGKRFGLSDSVVHDSKYRYKKYEYCRSGE